MILPTELAQDIKEKYGNICFASGFHPSYRNPLEMVEVPDDNNEARELWERYVPVLRKFAKANGFILPSGYIDRWRQKVIELRGSSASPSSPLPAAVEPSASSEDEGVMPPPVAANMVEKLREFTRQRAAGVGQG